MLTSPGSHEPQEEAGLDNTAKRIEGLKQKYGAEIVEAVVRAHPGDGLAMIAWADEADPHYAKLWLTFFAAMLGRGVLDERTRTLVVVGQFVAMNEMEQLGVHVRSALAHAKPGEVLEVILQAGVYIGYPKMVRATRILRDTLDALGRTHELAKSRVPLAGRSTAAAPEAERGGLQTPPERAARRDELIAKYGRQRLAPGLRLQPTHHLESVERLDRVDPDFNRLWLDFIYAGMYSRGVLDDRTRILCIVGELACVGETHQAENHIRNALTHGAKPREVLEVILMSTIYSGMPRFVRFIAILERALEEQGRLSEITARA
jgi:alkylhydroperoxidase/carboxymuconolactone decarboxylase family protein YurZ